MTETWDVVVVGSCMADLVCYTPRLPKSGETVCGTKSAWGFGGKGCNQCVAALKLGAKCLLVARIGEDHFGKSYYDKLLEYKISRKFVKITAGVNTGMAQITVSDTGENTIVIVPGANNCLSQMDVQEASRPIASCSILVCQLENPVATTIEALRIKAGSKTGKSILNAAPACENANSLIFTLPDVFCVNELEAETFCCRPVSNPEDAKEALKVLFSKGCKEVVITLGSQGCVYGKREPKEWLYIPAWPTVAVDTTGAGDAFVGALAFLMAKHPERPIQNILKKACIVAAISVARSGTQVSYPTIDELPKEFYEL